MELADTARLHKNYLRGHLETSLVLPQPRLDRGQPPVRVRIDRLLPEEGLIDIGNRAYAGLSQVVTPNGGIHASEDPRFHDSIFGRDTFIIAHFINATYQGKTHDGLWDNTRAAVFGFWDFQREDGKVLHEIKSFSWKKMQKTGGFYYPMGEYMVNDDSVDATPLALIVTPEFIQTRKEFVNFLPKAVKALDWMMRSMDKKNGWLSYSYNPHGLTHQGWMDSRYAVMLNNGDLPKDPIALVEVQAYAWKAMRMWSDLLRRDIPDISRNLTTRADDLKQQFNKQFIMHNNKGTYVIYALDGHGNQIRNVSINPGLALWANYNGESIIDEQYIPSVATRLRGPDMFDEKSGVRTFERGQPVHDKESYHNGENVYWPIATAMVAKGILELGYTGFAEELMSANLIPVTHFGSFIEQFSKNASYSLFRGGGKDGSCHNQSWTMAETLWIVNYFI